MNRKQRADLEKIIINNYCIGKTQQQLSIEFGVSQPTISRMIRKTNQSFEKNFKFSETLALHKIQKLVKFVDNLENSFTKPKNKSVTNYKHQYGVASRTRGPLPQGLRHLVFKMGDYRCKQCGVTAKETTLHIDHIIPFSRGGTDEIENLQILCKQCNFDKSDLVLRIEN